jgi:hypothetical protein
MPDGPTGQKQKARRNKEFDREAQDTGRNTSLLVLP